MTGDLGSGIWDEQKAKQHYRKIKQAHHWREDCERKETHDDMIISTFIYGLANLSFIQVAPPVRWPSGITV